MSRRYLIIQTHELQDGILRRLTDPVVGEEFSEHNDDAAYEDCKIRLATDDHHGEGRYCLVAVVGAPFLVLRLTKSVTEELLGEADA